MNDDRLYGGRYQLLDVIGDGGMARVFRATDTRLDRTVAIKLLREQFTGEPQFIERFKQEARLAAGLAHPNIVGVYDVGEEDGQYYMVMEYVPGDNLKQIIGREAPMPLGTIVSFMRQLAAALDYAHTHGVIHRDIKPENILVTDKREVKVGDFGIARAVASSAMTATGTVLGSVSYFSPEQASGQQATAESDLYSAGMVLYEMLTGHVPFSGPNPVAVAMAQVNDPPALPTSFVPEIPRAVESVVLKAIAKDPSQRYHTGFELMAALTAAAKPAAPQPVVAQTEVPRVRRAAPVVEAVDVGPTMFSGIQVQAAVAQQRGRRGNWGAIAALITTAVLLLAAVLIYHTISGSDSATPGPSASTTPTLVPTSTGATLTRVPGIVPTVAGPPTATFIVPPETSTPLGNQVPLPSSTPAGIDTPVDTLTPAGTFVPVPTATIGLPSETPTPAADTPTAGTPTPDTGTATPGTVTPVGGSETTTPGSSHGATVDLVTASKVGPHFVPEGVSSDFTAGTSTVYAVAKIHGKAKGDAVQFVWQYPDGSSFSLAIPDVTSSKGDVTAYAEISPRGPGTYTVNTSVNGHTLASATFTVAAHGASPEATVAQAVVGSGTSTPGSALTPQVTAVLDETATPGATEAASPQSAETATPIEVAPALTGTPVGQSTPSSLATIEPGGTTTIQPVGTPSPVQEGTTTAERTATSGTAVATVAVTETPAGQ